MLDRQIALWSVESGITGENNKVVTKTMAMTHSKNVGDREETGNRMILFDVYEHSKHMIDDIKIGIVMCRYKEVQTKINIWSLCVPKSW